MPLAPSLGLCDSSDLINCGAKVLVDWLWLWVLTDPARCLAVVVGARCTPPRGEKDWVLPWLPGLEGAFGEVTSSDLGRGLEGAGDGDGESLEKGLLRTRAPP